MPLLPGDPTKHAFCRDPGHYPTENAFGGDPEYYPAKHAFCGGPEYLYGIVKAPDKVMAEAHKKMHFADARGMRLWAEMFLS